MVLISTLFSLEALFFSLFEEDLLFDLAAERGFFYRYAEISEVSECPQNDPLCIAFDGKSFRLAKKGTLEILEKPSKESVGLEITPDNNFISYFLYVESAGGVFRTKITKKSVRISEKPEKIIKIQIVGTAPKGPEVIWEKPFSKAKTVVYTENFDKSLQKLRKKYGQKPVRLAAELENAADSALSRLASEGLVHYSTQKGSIRHSGVKKKVLGENLVIAKDEKTAWRLLVGSPSHLYNMINPQFRSYFFKKIEAESGEIYGVLIFSD